MDDKSKKGKGDDSRININESYELQYWSEKLNISRNAPKPMAGCFRRNWWL